MGHLPMGFMRDNHPRAEEVMGDASAFSMGMTAENIHDRFPELSREMADEYAVLCQEKADRAIKAGKMKEMIIPIEVELPEGGRALIDKDQPPRPGTTIDSIASLKTPFRENGRVTAGNASGLNDGAAAALIMSRDKALEIGLVPRMRWITTAVAGVDPRIMGTAPVPAVKKALANAGLTVNDIALFELNEAFAVQALHNLSQLGLKPEDPRVNPWGGSIAYGHPLAASGPRLVAFMLAFFKENPSARYGLTAMCVGRGQGFAMIWENLNSD